MNAPDKAVGVEFWDREWATARAAEDSREQQPAARSR